MRFQTNSYRFYARLLGNNAVARLVNFYDSCLLWGWGFSVTKQAIFCGVILLHLIALSTRYSHACKTRDNFKSVKNKI